ncbi:M64 family metallopeptidase [Candidatus Neomarinimicrobiota bacterium]
MKNQKYHKIQSFKTSAAILLILTISFGQDFNSWFTGQTLRLDYYHNGTAEEEHISLDQIRLEGTWPGNPSSLLDETNYGKYVFEVMDQETGTMIYSQSFASIFGEWQTIKEAANGIRRTFHESQRFPEPRKPVTVVLKKNNNSGQFDFLFSLDVDPQSRFVNRSQIIKQHKIWKLVNSGESGKKVDLLFLGDGYKKHEQAKFRRDALRMLDTLFKYEPYKFRKSDFNVWGVAVPSLESNISNPRAGIWKNNIFGTTFNTFDLDRYVLTYANKEVREIAAQAPYDALIIIANDEKYGGGGIYNLYATTTSDNARSSFVFIHELGHSFAGLGDEYYTSDVSYENFNPLDVEPNDPNITALHDPDKLKWQHLVDASTPLPTPWNKIAYDNGEQVNLKEETYYGKVGAFEGAGYAPKGMYRPEVTCLMLTSKAGRFCKVCQEAIDQKIEFYVK